MRATKRATTGVGEHTHIELSWDWGTGTFSAFVGLNRDGHEIDQKTITAVEFFEGKGTEPPMMMGHHSGRFVWGYELQMLIDSEQVKIEDVFDLVKLDLYEKQDDTTERRREALKDQLSKSNTDVDSLIVMHFQAVESECKEFIYKSEFRLNISECELRKLPIRIRISVPQMWSMKARERMQTAAKNAGLQLVTLSFEPENALAYFMNTIEQRQGAFGTQFRVGGKALVGDYGCGTADIVVYELEEALSASSRMKAVSSSSGGACGSQMINEVLLTLLESELEEQGGLAMVQAKLGFPDLRWRKTAMAGIEGLKCKFPDQAKYKLAFSGENGEDFRFVFTKDQLQGAFDRVIAEVITKTDAEVQHHDPKTIYITGGPARSRYFMGKMREQYEKNGTIVVKSPMLNCHAVANGGLLRYNRISAGNLPTKYGYGIVQEEEFHWSLHKDCVKWVEDKVVMEEVYDRWGDPKVSSSGNLKKRKVIRKIHHRDDGVVKPSFHKKGVFVVYDRLCVLFEKGSTIQTNKAVTQAVIQDYWLPIDDPRLSITLVYFDGDFETHDWSGRESVDSREFRQGIYHFKSVERVVSKALFKKHGIAATRENDGKWTYPVRCRVTIKYQGGHDMTVGWVMEVAGKEIELWQDDATVWEASHSQYPEQPQAASAGADGMDGVEESVTGGDEHGEEMELDD
ncbi:hypothetical protein LTS10_000921 [Elasticomyces elasticus]|nr:hypothetical protein LTS10_000921 [Elasticomyces elasticus]